MADGNTNVNFLLDKGQPVYFTLIDQNATGINELHEDTTKMQVEVHNRNVLVRNVTGWISAYDVTGRLYEKRYATESTSIKFLSGGVYILKYKDENIKIVIK